jgi:hypothetical protein
VVCLRSGLRPSLRHTTRTVLQLSHEHWHKNWGGVTSGFTVWLAGAGVKRVFHHGATDEFGYKAVEKVATIYDLHATILHLLGLDHTRLSFYNNGIERRLTDVHGHVIEEVLA